MDFLEATDAPAVRTIAGRPVVFALWTLDDLKVTAARLKQEQLAAARQACRDQAVPAVEAACLLGQLAAAPFDPRRLVEYFQTVEGVQEVLRVSLAKGGMVVAAADELLRALPFFDAQALAREVAHMEENASCSGAHTCRSSRCAATSAESGAAVHGGVLGPFVADATCAS